MPPSLLPLTLALFVLSVSASPSPRTTLPRKSISLVRRKAPSRTVEQWGKWAKAHKEGLRSKYGGKKNKSKQKKRSSGANLLTNQNYDSSFYGSIAIGTPAVSYNVILDTGSADLWVADSACGIGCSGVSTFDPSTSSTFVDQKKSFSITYGSGSASGSLGKDVIQMAGFSVQNQIFATCDTVSEDLLNSPVSGLMGLGFESISSAGVTPFWETLVKGGAWDDPVMAFQLTRFVNATRAQTEEFGGSFTMGTLDSTLYTGDIEFIDIPSGQETYWVQTISSITVGGQSIDIGSGSDVLAAIDTGTTLIGGPSASIAAIYAQVPGAQQGSGNFEGYYTFPCGTQIQVSMSFGGSSWAINSADMVTGQLNNGQCLGSFFELSTASSAPAWIVGDTFLKNVYSVYRYNPPSVGFAKLSDKAIALSNGDTAVPTATIGSVAAQVSATGIETTRSHNGAIGKEVGMWWMWMLVFSGLWWGFKL